MVKEGRSPITRYQVGCALRGSLVRGRRWETSRCVAVALEGGVGGGSLQVGEKGTFPSYGRLRHQLSLPQVP